MLATFARVSAGKLQESPADAHDASPYATVRAGKPS